MPVSVHIPTRIRIDSSALRNRQGDVAAALAAAAARALAASQQRVISARGGYMGVVAHPPDVCWTGDGIADVPAGLRAEIEALVVRMLVDVVVDSRINDFAHTAEMIDEPLTAEVREAIDRNQFDSRARTYRVPSYDRPAEEAEVPVEDTETEQEQIVEVWRGGESDWDEDRLYSEFVEQFFIGDYTMPTSGHLGIIFPHAAGGYGICVFRILKRTRHSVLEGKIELLDALHVHDLFYFVPHGQGDDIQIVQEPTQLAASSVFSIQYVRAATPAARRTVLEAQQRRVITDAFEQRREQIVAQYDEQGYQELVEERIRQAAATLEDDPTVLNYVLLDVDTRRFLIPFSRDVPQGVSLEPIQLMPLRDFARGRPGPDAGAGISGYEMSRGTGAGGQGGQSAQAGAGAQTGVVIEGLEPVAGAQGSAFPQLFSGESVTLSCDAFRGEPVLDDLGSKGEVLRRLIQAIAARLEMPPCDHAARFCINAAIVLGGRAAVIAEYSVIDKGFAEPVRSRPGNLGLLNFTPRPSAAILLLRHLAGVTPLVSELARRIYDTYTAPGNGDKIQGTRHGNPIGWQLDFGYELNTMMNQSVGTMFAMTCRVLMLQLLRSSHDAIRARVDNLPVYAQIFHNEVVPRLEQVDELLSLRDRLRTYIAEMGIGRGLQELSNPIASAAGTALIAYASWDQARQGLLDTLGATAGAASPSVREAGEIVDRDGTLGIRDHRGRIWTIQGLEMAIAMRRGEIESLDPLVKQMTELPELMPRLRSAADLEAELRRLLSEMMAHNTEITNNVKNDWIYAFRASRISQTLEGATVPYSRYALQGIHLLAHEQIGDAFQGDQFYAMGINSLFGGELGRADLLLFFEFTGVILLAVICPPLGIAAGIGAALYHLEEAHERERTYGSLIDPELVLTHAEVEAELFAARLGVALSLIPEARTVLGAAGKGVTTVARQGVRESAALARASLRRATGMGVRGIGAAISRRLTLQIAQQIERGVIEAFAREMVTAEFLNRFLILAIEPVIRRVERESMITGPVGGAVGAQQVIFRLISEQSQAQEGAGGRGGVK